MRDCLSLLLCSLLLAGCASKPQDPSGVWINQAAIDAARESGKLRESLQAYGPTFEWRLDTATGRADGTNGFETSSGRLSTDPATSNRWRVDLDDQGQDALHLDGAQLVQEASPHLPEQRFARPSRSVPANAPLGSGFEEALYAVFLGGDWIIREGNGEGGRVRFGADGSLEGLPGTDRYALCLAGDCASTSEEHDSLWLQQGNQGAPWIFTRQGDTLEIFAAVNRAQQDEIPDLVPGPRRWLLRRD